MGIAGFFLIIAGLAAAAGFLLPCFLAFFHQIKVLKKYHISWGIFDNGYTFERKCAQAGVLNEYNAAKKKDIALMGKIVKICIIIFITSIIVGLPVAYIEDSGSSPTVSSRTCPSCGRSFSEGSSDYSNIGYAGMCDNCERNYHLANGE